MNSEGVCVGINNLTALDGRPGVAWTSVVRGMLTTSNARDALDVLLGADLAGAHNFLIFDANGEGYNVEAMPSARPVTKLDADPIAHTNHAIDEGARAFEVTRDPPLLASSQTRLDTATELIADGPVDVRRLFDLTAEPGAICQQPAEPYHMESSGGAVMRPRTGEFWACWGPPADNDYVAVAAHP